MNSSADDRYLGAAEGDVLARLRHAEDENAKLRAENDRLRYNLSALGEELEDANNEISRLCMVLKHRDKGERYCGRLRRVSELLLASGRAR